MQINTNTLSRVANSSENRVTDSLDIEKVVLPKRKAVVSRFENRKWTEHVPGERISIPIRSSEVDGAYAVMEGIIAPQSGGPPLHYHSKEDEIFYIAEGSLEFYCEGELFDAPKGTVLVIPKGSHHTFRNITDQPAQAIVIFTPGGSETMFEDFVGKKLEEMEKIQEGYGTFFVGPPLGDDQAAFPLQ